MSQTSRQPLPPLYVSTVDSGNLAGHLLTLGAGLLQLCDQPLYQTTIFPGLRDTLELAREPDGKDPAWASLFTMLDAPPRTPAEAATRLDQLSEQATRLAGEPDPGRAVRELIVTLIETSATKSSSPARLWR